MMPLDCMLFRLSPINLCLISQLDNVFVILNECQFILEAPLYSAENLDSRVDNQDAVQTSANISD